jgi:hypothetical protein
MDVPDEFEVSRWVAPTFIFCSVVLIPWIVYLGFSLPARQVSHHNDIAWVGYDVFELIALGATGYLALRRSRYLALPAASAATLLICDAWFDILTSSGHQIAESVLLAVVIELPLASVCAWLSFHTERLAERQVSVMRPRRDQFRRARQRGNGLGPTARRLRRSPRGVRQRRTGGR